MLATSLLFRDCCSFSGTGSLACRLAPKTATPCACPGCASHFPASKLRMHISRIAIRRQRCRHSTLNGTDGTRGLPHCCCCCCCCHLVPTVFCRVVVKRWPSYFSEKFRHIDTNMLLNTCCWITFTQPNTVSASKFRPSVWGLYRVRNRKNPDRTKVSIWLRSRWIKPFSLRAVAARLRSLIDTKDSVCVLVCECNPDRSLPWKAHTHTHTHTHQCLF